MVAAAYATKLLADLGAEVIKIEPPAGDPARRRGPFPGGESQIPNCSGLYLYLNTNKRSVTLDLAAAARPRRAASASSHARDLLVHNLPPRSWMTLGLDLRRARGAQPAPGDDVDHAVRPRRAAARLAGHRPDAVERRRHRLSERQPGRRGPAAAGAVRHQARVPGRRSTPRSPRSAPCSRGCAPGAASTSWSRSRNRSPRSSS